MFLNNILHIMKVGEITKYYKKNKMVISLAKKVEKQSKIYEKQLLKCQKFLNKNKFIIF